MPNLAAYSVGESWQDYESTIRGNCPFVTITEVPKGSSRRWQRPFVSLNGRSNSANIEMPASHLGCPRLSLCVVKKFATAFVFILVATCLTAGQSATTEKSNSPATSSSAADESSSEISRFRAESRQVLIEANVWNPGATKHARSVSPRAPINLQRVGPLPRGAWPSRTFTSSTIVSNSGLIS